MTAKYISGAAFFSRGFDSVMAKEDLLSQDEGRQLSALEQIIAYMGIGRDMSGLFNEIAALTSSTNVVIKRLVYLYLLQNSRVQPEKAVLQAGTFVKDTLHDSPLFRGAALRTMSNLQIGVMSDFLTGPIRRCLEDADPYVRRIAALAVVKQYITAPSIAFDFVLLEKLKDLLEDENALVCGTAVMALLELHSRGAPGDLQLAVASAKEHFLEKLPEGNEWSTHFLLEGIAIAYYRLDEHRVAADTFLREGEQMLMQVLPYLSSQNTATSTSANKVAALFLRRMTNYPGLAEERKAALDRRFAPHMTQALLSQLEAPRYELRYIAFRNVQVFAQSRRMVPFLTEHLVAFLVKHGDPIFVKLEKLDVLVTLASEKNGTKVLSELVIYTRDPDAELVSKSIRAVGVLATQLPALAPQCVLQLEALINTRVPHIVEDAAVVVQNILRSYPGKFTDIIPILCDALTVCNSVDARAAVAWVLGEYTDCVPSALDYLDVFVEDFMEQPRQVQYAVLTALAKMHTRGVKGKEARVLATLERTLNQATACLVPDLRDRALFYWRLLALDSVTARDVLSAEEHRTPPHLAATTADRRNQEAFLVGLGAVESVVHRPLSSVLGDHAVGGLCAHRHIGALSSDEDTEDTSDSADRAGGGTGDGDDEDAHAAQSAGALANGAAALSDKLHGRGVGLAGSIASGSPTTPSMTGVRTDGIGSSSSAFYPVLSAEDGGGVEVAMQWSQLGTKLVLNCKFQLEYGEDYVQRARVVNLQVNRNMHGLGVQQVFPTTNLEPGEKPATAGLIVACNNARKPTRDIQVAMEIEPVGVRYFVAPAIPPAFLLLPATGCEMVDFLTWWKQFPSPTWRMPPQVADVPCAAHRLTANALRVHCVNLVHRSELAATATGKTSRTTTGFFLFAETIGRQRLLMEMTVEGGVVVLLTVRCEYPPIAAFFGEYIQHCVAGLV